MNKIVANRYIHEYDLLKTTIDIIQEENVALKTRLASMVQSGKLLPNRLLKAEQLHSQLVKMDEHIVKYRKELKFHLSQVQQSKSHETSTTTIFKQEEKLQRGIDRIKTLFLDIKQNLDKFTESPDLPGRDVPVSVD